MRTIDVSLAAPLLTASTVVAAHDSWSRPRLELAVATQCADGVRICFHYPDDVRAFAAAVRRFATDCRAIEPPPAQPVRPAKRPSRPSPLPFGF